MEPMTTVAVILKLLEWTHAALHPFFTNDEQISNKDLELIVTKLDEIKNEIKNIEANRA